MSGFVVNVLPQYIVDVVTMHDRIPDEMFMVNCKDDASMAIAIVNGNAVIRDFAFASRWDSVFVKWTNLPQVASFAVSALPAVLDYMLPYYAGTWRTQNDARKKYEDPIVCSKRMSLPPLAI
jgi:hypothetical protein